MATKAPDYTVNYEDERFANVEADKQEAMSELNNTYKGMIDGSDKYYDAQIEASKDWADKQSQLQQEQTDFTIEQIEQQKDQAHKDYVKEQSGAYVDWQKQSNEYGAEAEKKASAGLTATGYSESSQVSMYNTYQNRVAAARESYSRAILNYDNSIKEARLQNNAILAEIAYESLQQQLELSLQGFQYKNQLILDQANKKIELDNTYYNRYLKVLEQINTENAMAEDIRQYEQNYALQVKQYDESVRQFNKNYELKVKEYNENIRQFNEEIARLKAKDEKEHQLEIQRLELEKKKVEEAKRQFEEEMKLKKQQLQAQQSASKITKSSSGGGSSKKSPTSGSSGKVTKPTTANTTSGATVNQQSVAALGRGPLTSAALANLVATGQVIATQNGNQIYVQNAPNSSLAAGQAALNKYKMFP